MEVSYEGGKGTKGRHFPGTGQQCWIHILENFYLNIPFNRCIAMLRLQVIVAQEVLEVIYPRINHRHIIQVIYILV